jgi:NarL family two-component system response regulator LiaR
MTADLGEPSTACVRVLIVDDHEVVRKGIRAMLSESPGFEVVGEAHNGQDAVLRARETQPDVILMDLLMPVMDGIEATRQITASQRETGVLVLTSFATDKDLFPTLEAGPWATCSKTLHPRVGVDPPGGKR